MAQYFLIVNVNKKQFLDPYRFGEGMADLQIASGYHAQALALLVCNMDEVHGGQDSLMSLWGRNLILAAGDYAFPNMHGIITVTSENAKRNLYYKARDEFEDISYIALAMLCRIQETVCYELAEKAANPRYRKVLFHLGNVIKQVGCYPLENALLEVLGSGWNQDYMEITKVIESEQISI